MFRHAIVMTIGVGSDFTLAILNDFRHYSAYSTTNLYPVLIVSTYFQSDPKQCGL